MPVVAFPSHRIVRYPSQIPSGISPVALVLIPAAIWVGCVSWWIQRILDTDAAMTAAAVKEQVRR